ncbi:longitudinals lacking protein, isoforms H/M/V-like [Centruroides vittatus]|uniref:longitudinals lacking protein, isoforms H/M/V-like n=1 Tax=Centruroides vittatus TaxID=120091 RepID=UPI00351018A6
MFADFYSTGRFVDVTLMCEGKILKCHKIILSSFSPYFCTLFLENPSNDTVVYLTDLKYKLLKDLIDFMYYGEVQLTLDQMSEFIDAADKFQIKNIVKMIDEKNDESKYLNDERCVKTENLIEELDESKTLIRKRLKFDNDSTPTAESSSNYKFLKEKLEKGTCFIQMNSPSTSTVCEYTEQKTGILTSQGHSVTVSCNPFSQYDKSSRNYEQELIKDGSFKEMQNDDKFFCEVCNISFIHKSRLQRHMQLHSLESDSSVECT